MGIMYYAALVPCICAALIAHKIAFSLGVQTENFHVMNDLELSLIPGLKVVLLAICCAILSILFLHDAPDGEALFKNIFPTFISESPPAALPLILPHPHLRQPGTTLAQACPSSSTPSPGQRSPGPFSLKCSLRSSPYPPATKAGKSCPPFSLAPPSAAPWAPSRRLPASLRRRRWHDRRFLRRNQLPRNLHPQ